MTFDDALVRLEPDVLRCPRARWSHTTSEENVKDDSHLTFRLPDASLEARRLKVYSTLLNLDLGADVVLGVVRFQRVQTISVPDAFAHPLHLLLASAVR
jgi:hypothetical protein